MFIVSAVSNLIFFYVLSSCRDERLRTRERFHRVISQNLHCILFILLTYFVLTFSVSVEPLFWDPSLNSLRSWRYCVIKVLAAEPRSKKGSGDEAFEFLAVPPPNLTRLVHNTASYAGYSLKRSLPFREHKIWCRKNVHIIFVLLPLLKGHLYFRGKGHFFSGSRDPGRVKPLFKGHLCTQKVTDHKNRSWIKSALVTMATAFKTFSVSIKSMYYTCGNSTSSIVEIC